MEGPHARAAAGAQDPRSRAEHTRREKINTYAIYYGWLTEDDCGEPNASACRIAAARVPLVIANAWTAAPERHRNLSRAVLGLMHASGTAVYAYVATDCGRRERGDVEADIADALDAGVDGIFFDEADSLREGGTLPYYAALSRTVRAAGRRVIVNPGVARCGERIMDVADIVMVEHQWRDLKLESVWSMRYPPDRFMGVSSNEARAMGYAIDADRGVADTREAWQRGIGWHTSTDLYIEVPEWFERYVDSTRQAITKETTWART